MHDPMGMPHELVEHDRVEQYLIIAGKAMAISGGVLFIALIAADLRRFLDRCRRYFEFFLGEFGGRSLSPLALRDALLADAESPLDRPPEAT